MNILFIATYPEITGATISLIGLTTELKKMGHYPIVISKSEGYLTDKLKEQEIEYEIVNYLDNTIGIAHRNKPKHFIKFSVKKIINFFANLKIKKILKLKKIDIVHYNAITVDVGFESIRAAQIPIIWHIREFLEEDHHSMLMEENKARKKINSAERIIVISDSIEEKYSKIFDIDKIKKISNGIDYEPFEELEKSAQKKIVLGVVGRIAPGKGQLDVVKAFRLVADDVENLELHFVGPISDSTYYEEILRYIQKNSLEKSVIFCGSKTKVQDIWGSLDIVVISSEAEAFGRVTVEAMFAKKIVLGANSAGTKEILNSVGSDLLFEPSDIKSLSFCIKKVVENMEYYENKVESVKLKAMNLYTSSSNANNLLLEYSKIINE